MLALKNADQIQKNLIKKPEDMDYDCPKCGKPMNFYNIGRQKHLVTFEGVFFVKFELYRCKNPACDFRKPMRVQSSDIVPCTSFGADVLYFILRERWKFKQTLVQVLMRLVEDKNLLTSRSQVNDFFNLEEELLVKESVEKAKKRIAKTGEILLSLDGMGTKPGMNVSMP